MTTTKERGGRRAVITALVVVLTIGVSAGGAVAASTATGVDTRAVSDEVTASEDAIDVLNATRSIEETTLEPGESTTVTVEVTASEPDELVVYESFTPALEAIEIHNTTQPTEAAAVTDSNDELVAVWEEVETTTVQYEVTLPEDAERSLVIDGEADGSHDSLVIGGPDEIAVDQNDGGAPALPPISDDDEPDISVEGIQVSATEIEIGDTLTVTVDVTNGGGAAGEDVISLTVGEDEITSEPVSLDEGESTTLEFEHTFDDPGEFTVAVNDHEATVSVSDSADDDVGENDSSDDDVGESDSSDDDVDATEPDDVESDDQVPGFGVVAAVGAVLLTAVRLRR